DVYKCTSRSGAVAFQDTRCAADDAQQLVRVRGDPDYVPAPAPAPAAPTKQRAAAAPSEPQRTPRALPPLWLCMNAEDRSRYVSRNGSPRVRSVPLGVLGFSGKSLAETYRAGANVMSAPELSRPPIDRSPQSSASASYTTLQDSCVRASADQS